MIIIHLGLLRTYNVGGKMCSFEKAAAAYSDPMPSSVMQ